MIQFYITVTNGGNEVFLPPTYDTANEANATADEQFGTGKYDAVTVYRLVPKTIDGELRNVREFVSRREKPVEAAPEVAQAVDAKLTQRTVEHRPCIVVAFTYEWDGEWVRCIAGRRVTESHKVNCASYDEAVEVVNAEFEQVYGECDSPADLIRISEGKTHADIIDERNDTAYVWLIV